MDRRRSVGSVAGEEVWAVWAGEEVWQWVGEERTKLGSKSRARACQSHSFLLLIPLPSFDLYNYYNRHDAAHEIPRPPFQGSGNDLSTVDSASGKDRAFGSTFRDSLLRIHHGTAQCYCHQTRKVSRGCCHDASQKRVQP